MHTQGRVRAGNVSSAWVARVASQERPGRQGAGSGCGRKMSWLMKDQRAATTGNPFREVPGAVYGCRVRLEEGKRAKGAGPQAQAEGLDSTLR